MKTHRRENIFTLIIILIFTAEPFSDCEIMTKNLQDSSAEVEFLFCTQYCALEDNDKRAGVDTFGGMCAVVSGSRGIQHYRSFHICFFSSIKEYF